MTQCARDHSNTDDGKPAHPEAAPGALLCRSCLGQAEKNLSLLPSLYAECMHAISAVPRRPALERVSGSRPVDGFNDAAIDVRRTMLSVLSSWARLVAEERRLNAPPQPVPQLTRFLTSHLDWLAGHPEASEFVDEVDALMTEAQNTLGPAESVRHIALGPCIMTGCGGAVTARMPGQEDPAPTGISCDAGHAWQPHHWLLFGDRIPQEEKV